MVLVLHLWGPPLPISLRLRVSSIARRLSSSISALLTNSLKVWQSQTTSWYCRDCRNPSMKHSTLAASVLTSSGTYLDKRLNYCTYSLTVPLPCLKARNSRFLMVISPGGMLAARNPSLNISHVMTCHARMIWNPSHHALAVPLRQ